MNLVRSALTRIDPGRPAAVGCGALAAALCLACIPCAALAQSDSGAPAHAEPLMRPISGTADEGTFRFYLNEEAIVTTDFTWRADGSYHGEYTVSMAGQSVVTAMAVSTDAAGHWTDVELTSPLGKVSIAREGLRASITRENEVATVELKPGTVLFENFNPALMSLALRAYDQGRGGRQTFPIFILPHVVMDGSLERLDTVTRAVAGRDLLLTRYTYGLPGVDVTMFVDPEGRVVFADVPAQHGAYVREGYEALRAPAETDARVSAAEHEVVVESNVGVPMRDGLALATDLYRPQTPGRHPVVLVRTPYKKEMNELQGRFFARRGYVYAVQDCRGRFSSPGLWEPFVNEARDGYDTIEWLAAQPWSTGKVGMIGASYLGWVQWWAARDHPPHLTTIIPNVAPPDPFYNIPYEYGAFFLLGAIWWADVLESEATGDLSGKAMLEISEKKYMRLLRHLPVVDLDELVLGERNPYWREWIAHPDNDAYWEPANFLGRLGGLDIPVFHQSGWFDGDGIGAKLNYLRMQSHGHRYQKLVLGPWGHTDTATRRIGERDFGEAAIIDLQQQYLRWLDHWLKGVDNGIDREPLVSLFVMGADEWRHGNRYPLAGTRMTRYYLRSRGRANTSGGDGWLAPESPSTGEPPDRYVYDPGDPTPSPRLYVSAEDLAPAEDAGDTTVVSVEDERRRQREYYARIDRERADILVYDTPPLSAPLAIAGPISAVLYAASSARDTDWFMRVAEVDSLGEVFWLTEGKLRARHRNSTSTPELLSPGIIYRYDLDLWHTAIEIPAGHRLRVEVASASFPMFSRNLNTGGHSETERKHVTARQTIYHDAAHPSHVLLPVLPATD